MKISSLSFFAVSALALLSSLSAVSAAQFTARVNAFQSADLPALSPDLAFRFAALVGLEGSANETTHVLLQGLSPLAPASSVHVSNYSAINLTSGVEQDAGVVYLDVPSTQVPAGAVASPIVGVVQRTGAWSNANPQTPSTTVGGSAGTSTYDAEAGSISFVLDRGGQSFTGTTTYTVFDVDTISLAPFSLSGHGLTYTFHETTLARDGVRFYGVLESSDLAVAYDSLLHVIEFVDLPVRTGEDIPEIVGGGGGVGGSITDRFAGTMVPNGGSATTDGWWFSFNFKDVFYFGESAPNFVFIQRLGSYFYIHPDGTIDDDGIFAFAFDFPTSGQNTWVFLQSVEGLLVDLRDLPGTSNSQKRIGGENPVSFFWVFDAQPGGFYAFLENSARTEGFVRFAEGGDFIKVWPR